MDQVLQSRLAAVLTPAYEIDGELGRGGMAIVYRARDVRLKRAVAIKLLPPELAYRGDIKSRFLREAETAARLSHPNIVPIYSVDEREGMVFFIMALVEGESVGDRIRRAGPIPAPETKRILREVADALSYAHSHGVIHRDVKPDNILLDKTSGRAMVTDFGIARAASDEGDGSRLTATGAVIGTPSYMSPEQCAGDREIDGRSDLYSLGTVAYQMLTGEPPFIGGNAPALMMKQVTERPVPPRDRRGDVPEDLNRIVMKLLAKQPAERFTDGAALVAALDGAPVAVAAENNWSRYGVPAEVQERIARRMETLPAPTRAIIERQLERVEERLSRSEERRADRARRKRRDKDDPGRPMSERVRRFHGRMLSYMGTSAFMFAINAMTMSNLHGFWWAWFPVIGLGFGAITDAGRLIGDGATGLQLLGLAKVDDAALPAPKVEVMAVSVPREVPLFSSQRADANAELRNGPYGGVLNQAMTDRQTVTDLLGRLSDTERKMLPEMKETADALFQRIIALAAALTRMGGEVDPARMKSLGERIGQIEQESGDGADRERRLNLLRRQKEMLADLLKRRAALLEQYESAGLLLQNMALDLLKVRSSGLDSAINGLTSATQEARALSREIGYVLAANEEMKRL